MDSEIGFVYLIKSHETGFIKIGFSKDPLARLECLQTSSPSLLYLLATLKCSNPRSIEKSIHNHFASKRINGEWFSLSDSDLSTLFASYKAGLNWDVYDHHWSDDLVCSWKKWEVVSPWVLKLTLAPGHSCDLGGCSKIASMICPSVLMIESYSGEKLDMVFLKYNGQWHAREISKNELEASYPSFLSHALKTSVSVEKRKRKIESIKNLDNFDWPENLYSPEFEEAWRDWWDYINSKKKDKVSVFSAKALLKVLSDAGEDRAVNAIRKAISNGWMNVHLGQKDWRIA